MSRSKIARTQWEVKTGRRRSTRSKKWRAATRNRSGPYLCVFGIVIEKGQRLIKAKGKSKSPHSFNTVWLSDFFWPFFSNFSYSQIAKAVLQVLMQEAADGRPAPLTLIPDTLMYAFGEECTKRGLLDSDGNFSDPEKLIDVFCDTKGV